MLHIYGFDRIPVTTVLKNSNGKGRDPAQTVTCTGGRDYLHTVRFYLHNNLRFCLHASLPAHQLAIFTATTCMVI